MKNSKVLRGICYLLIPILVAIIILSSFYVFFINEGSFTTEEAFFNGNNFKSAYFSRIGSLLEELIFANEDYKTIQDGERTIYFTNPYPIYGIENCGDFLIIYQNKVLTNIKVTEETNTVEKIKAYVLEKNKNNFCYENREFSSNIEGFVTNNTENYFNDRSITYYTNDVKQNVSVNEVSRMESYNYENDSYYDENGNLIIVGDYYYDENGVLRPVENASEEVKEIEETPITDSSVVVSPDASNTVTPTKTIEYHTAELEDFTFYTSFNPKLDENSDIKLVIDTMKFLKPYEQQIIISMPISVILTLIIIIFLINSIGHVKGKEELELNDFDKIPLEIIYGISFFIIAALFVIIEEISLNFITSKQTFYTTVATIYAIFSVLLEICAVTTVARIKAKKFLDTCWCGRFAKWCWKLFKIIIKKCFNILHNFNITMKKVKKSFTENMSLTWILIIAICVYVLIAILLLGILGPIGAIIDLAIVIYAIYQVTLRLNSFKKLEDSLRKIYEGEKVILYNSDFSREFEKCVEYVNDISNGFENAIQEGLKSERLKTELITNVSHDIKTPLTSIINYVDLIKKENIDNDKIKEYIDILDNKSQRLKKLTEDLVEASKASSGNVSLNLEEIRIVELLNQAMGEYKDKFEEKKLEIISNISKENIKINADSRYIYRVIDNLFGNISKYALDNSRVYVETEVKDKNVKIILKNISKDRLNITEEELMQRFVRGDKSRTTEGSGLGLAIARSLTELQGGTLNCKIDGDLFKVEIEFKTI